MLTSEQAGILAAKWLPGADKPELVQDGDFWRAYRPGRTSVSLLIGADGGALYYHIAEKTDDQAKADYLQGERSEIPDFDASSQPEQPSEEEVAEGQRQLDASRQNLKVMLDEYSPKSE